MLKSTYILLCFNALKVKKETNIRKMGKEGCQILLLQIIVYSVTESDKYHLYTISISASIPFILN